MLQIQVLAYDLYFLRAADAGDFTSVHVTKLFTVKQTASAENEMHRRLLISLVHVISEATLLDLIFSEVI